MADHSYQKDRIATLTEVDHSKEHLMAVLGHKLMAGVDIGHGWLRMVKNNDKVLQCDDRHLRTDFRLELNGLTIGYVDIEEKRQWRAGGWPYDKINIARYPMSHWSSGHFDGRPTNKILSFREMPGGSFWVAMRCDYQACMVVSAVDLFAFGAESTQMTGYSTTPLPIYEMPNGVGRLCETAETFTAFITSEVIENADH
jgi:hypothetical protein